MRKEGEGPTRRTGGLERAEEPASSGRRRRIFAALAAIVAMGVASPSEAAEPKPAPWSAERAVSEPEDLRVEFVAFSPGSSIPSWFGHSAIVIEDRRLGVSRLYNYGMFSFDGTLLLKFAMGRLWFWVGQQPEKRTYEFYESQGRGVRIHELNLPPAKRRQIAEFLAWNARPENRDYLYHHYRNNCATKPRDILDEAVGGALRRATSRPSELTLREHTRRFSHHNPPMDLLLMFMMNDSIDQSIREWDAMFLPGELEENVVDLEYETSAGETVPLVAETEVYYEGESRTIPDRAPPNWPWVLLVGAVLGGAGVAASWWWRRGPERAVPRAVLGLHQAAVGAVAGLPGTVLYLMSVATDHTVTYWNENLFFANPLTLAVLPLGIALAAGRRGAVDWLQWIWTGLAGMAALGLVLKGFPSFDQQNVQPICFLVPITVGCAVAFHWGARRSAAPPDEG